MKGGNKTDGYLLEFYTFNYVLDSDYQLRVAVVSRLKQCQRSSSCYKILFEFSFSSP